MLDQLVQHTRQCDGSSGGQATPRIQRNTDSGALIASRNRHEPYDLRKRLRWRLVVAPLPTGQCEAHGEAATPEAAEGAMLAHFRAGHPDQPIVLPQERN
jgi:hypothetical protein